MPQEIALPMLMNVKEALNFFANIYQMDMRIFKQRYKMLIDMLELSNENAVIQDLSGGEQRKVSLAVAFIHNPKFVILDEPTVGLDMEIRFKIWNFLNQSKNNLTVLMTTHYPNEAEKADICGFMRNGRLLVDDAPGVIMNNLNVKNLDEACLSLCLYQTHIRKLNDLKNTEEVHENSLSDESIGKKRVSSFPILKALTTKKLLWVKRSKL